MGLGLAMWSRMLRMSLGLWSRVVGVAVGWKICSVDIV